MKITKEFLKEKRACRDGVEWFLDQNENDLFKIIDNLKEEGFDWSMWLITKVLNKENKVRLAIFCAERVLYIFEEKSLDYKRARKAIRAAKDWLEDKDNASSLSAAYNAVDAVGKIAVYTKYKYAFYAALYCVQSTLYDVVSHSIAYAVRAHASYSGANVYIVRAKNIELEIIDYSKQILKERIIFL